MHTIIFSKQAHKDKALLKQAGLEAKAKQLLNLMRENPFATPPSYEKLHGDMNGMYSRRINVKHRLVYEIDTEAQIVHVLRMWTHYE